MGMGVPASCSLSRKGGFTGSGMHAVLRGYLTMMHTKLLLGLVQEVGEEEWCEVDFQKRVFDEVIRDEHALRYPPSKAYSLRFVKAYLDAIARHSSGEIEDSLIEWYTDELQSLPRPELEGGPPPLPHFKTYPTPLGCVTVRTTDGFGGYETAGGTGNTLWEAAFYLCEFVLLSGDIFAGKRIVELGAGCGMTGVLLSRLPNPPASITMTDHTKRIIDNIAANMRSNGVPTASGGGDGDFEAPGSMFGGGGCVEVCPCARKGDDLPVTSMLLDWETFGDEHVDRIGPVDIVIGADIIFDPTLVPPLADTILRLLKRGAQFCLLVATVRNIETLGLFEMEAEQRGMSIERVPLKSKTEAKEGGKSAFAEKVNSDEVNSGVEEGGKSTFAEEIDGSGEMRMFKVAL